MQPQLDKVVAFVDESDPDFERKDLLRGIDEKVELGHWKAATRKLKKYARRFGDDEPIPEQTLVAVLEVCMEQRLQGARASEPARKILEQMVEQGYPIPEKAGNYCIKNTLGRDGPLSTHQGFGGLDTALAMLSAMDQSGTPIQLETYDRLCTALAKEGSIDEALSMLRKVVADLSQTPTLSTFAAVGYAAALKDDLKEVEKVPNVLAYAKAAGYDLDTIASIEDGRSVLAAGLISAEKLDNVGLGLRLLTAAAKAPGVDPDRGDDLVCSSSAPAQRAATLIHKRAINKAVEDQQWKLAVKLLELMMERSLKPSKWIWRNVVTCCAKAERSKKATSLLLDWVKLSDEGQAEKPALSVFNSVLNACEICGEQDLTIQVLDAMKQTHETEGNIITFNIALKRLAKQGNTPACEGMIIGMLREGVEPSVVSYTTAIASCVSNEEAKQPALAYEWLNRMRSRRVNPNVLTYNTALASCVDEGKLDSAILASRIASEMLRDVEVQLQTKKPEEIDSFTNVIPDATTKFLARRLVEQVDAAVEAGDMDARVADETVKKALVALAEYVNCSDEECFLEQIAVGKVEEEDEMDTAIKTEMDLETKVNLHKIAEV